MPPKNSFANRLGKIKHPMLCVYRPPSNSYIPTHELYGY